MNPQNLYIELWFLWGNGDKPHTHTYTQAEVMLSFPRKIKIEKNWQRVQLTVTVPVECRHTYTTPRLCYLQGHNGYAVVQLFVALRYKPLVAGSIFDGITNFSLT